MKIYYDNKYTASDYAFDTTRKAKEVATAIAGRVELASPGDTGFDLTRIHDAEYVDAVMEGTPIDLAESQGFGWDEQFYDMVRAHTDGLVAATRDVLTGGGRSGSLSSGLHHARREHGAGFCTFNGLAAAAETAVDLGAQKVLVLDLDAHYGGGTHSIMGDTAAFTQVDVTVSPFDGYLKNDRDFVLLSDESTYVADVDRALEFADRTQWDLVIYNAGMDPYNAGVTFEQLVEREQLVADWLGGTPAVFALAGGYTWGDVTMEELVDLHSLTVDAWIK
jgi:acetoin utilization deacetylase AcuC-like enzyme